MDYGTPFAYMFSSQNWIKKLILGVAMFLTPVLGPIVMLGWSLDVLRNIKQDQIDPLPEWTGDDFARWLGRGLGLTVAILTFLLPVIVIALILFVIFSVFNGVIIGTLDSGDTAQSVASVLSFCMCCVGVILYVVIALGAQVVTVRYASTDKIDVGLDYVKTFQLVGENIAPLLIITVLLLIWTVLVYILAIITLGIFGLIAPVLTILVWSHFGAQLSQRPGFTT